LVLGMLLVEGGVEVSELLLQPVNTALNTMPNSTTKDNFFIGIRKLSRSRAKHK